MTTLLLDASVLLTAFDHEDSNQEASAALLIQPDLVLSTIDLIRYEVANVAIRAWRSPESLRPLLDAVDQIHRDGGVLNSTYGLLTRAAELAGLHAISVYDASYLAAAEAEGSALVSCDQRDLVSKGLAVLPAEASA